MQKNVYKSSITSLFVDDQSTLCGDEERNVTTVEHLKRDKSVIKKCNIHTCVESTDLTFAFLIAKQKVFHVWYFECEHDLWPCVDRSIHQFYNLIL